MKNKSHLFVILLGFQSLLLILYTTVVGYHEGFNLFPVFIKNILTLDWNGQFNLDFSCYLILSGVWVVWRNQYKLSSWLIASLASVLGIVFFAPYLLWLVTKENGNITKVLVGDRV